MLLLLLPFVTDQGEPVHHPNWLTAIDKKLDAKQAALFSIDLRAAFAKATVETTDNETSLGITRELTVVALTELTPAAIANDRYWAGRDSVEVFAHYIKRWQKSAQTTPSNTRLIKAMRAEAALQRTPHGQFLWAAARLVGYSYPVNYTNPRAKQTPIKVGKMSDITADFLTVCLAVQAYDRVCVQRSISTVVEVINERF
jgi:hypothetical protein